MPVVGNPERADPFRAYAELSSGTVSDPTGADAAGGRAGPRQRSSWVARDALLATAETLTATVRTAFGAVSSADLIGWCEKIGVALKWVHGPEEGHYVRERGAGSIHIRPGGSDVRRNFTMAHEIGHHFVEEGRSNADFRRHLDAPTLRTLASIEVGADTEEMLCNLFAVSLLLPAERVIGVLGQQPVTLTAVRRLARIFGVSPSSLTNRLNDLQISNAVYARCHSRGDHYEIIWMTGGSRQVGERASLRLCAKLVSTPREGLLCADRVHAVEVDMDERPDGYCVALIRPQHDGVWRVRR